MSTAEPDDLIDITSAESRFAASSKLDDVRVEDSKKRLTTVRPRSVGSFFTSPLERAREGAREREQPLDVLPRQVGDRDQVPRAELFGGRSSARSSGRTSAMGFLTSRGRDEQDAVDLVDLEELHLDALPAGGREVLAHVVGADRELAVAAVDEHGELDALGAAVVEEGVDRGADRAARCRGRRRRARTSSPRAGSRGASP